MTELRKIVDNLIVELSQTNIPGMVRIAPEAVFYHALVDRIEALQSRMDALQPPVREPEQPCPVCGATDSQLAIRSYRLVHENCEKPQEQLAYQRLGINLDDLDCKDWKYGIAENGAEYYPLFIECDGMIGCDSPFVTRNSVFPVPLNLATAQAICAAENLLKLFKMQDDYNEMWRVLPSRVSRNGIPCISYAEALRQCGGIDALRRAKAIRERV